MTHTCGFGVQGVAGVLAGVQAQVAKEQVVWKAGPLVMAPLVQSSLAASQVPAFVMMISTTCFPSSWSWVHAGLSFISPMQFLLNHIKTCRLHYTYP